MLCSRTHVILAISMSLFNHQPIFQTKQTEAQRGRVTCPRTHSWYMCLGLEPSHLLLQSPASAYSPSPSFLLWTWSCMSLTLQDWLSCSTPCSQGPVITALPLTGHCQFSCLSGPPLQGDTGMSQHLAQGLAHGGQLGGRPGHSQRLNN